MLSSLKGRESLRSAVLRIAFRQDEQAADAVAVKEDKSEFLGSLDPPSFAAKSVNRARHGAAQVSARLEPLAFQDLPLQVEHDQVPRRLRAGVDIVPVASHGVSFANGEARRPSSSGGSS